jgi:hypothetical protein
MRFFKLFFVSTGVAYLIYCLVVLTLIDAPILAEYWVNEMITVKSELVKEYSGQRKLIVAGGSSALFGLDAEYASKQLNMPVINFGLQAGLSLEKILRTVGSVVEPGDLLVLALEPGYFGCSEGFTTWQVNNIIAWDHDSWNKLDNIRKVEFITSVSSGTLVRMILSAIMRKYYPARISRRLLSFDKPRLLAAFRERPMPVSFEYSVFHLDNHGDMLRTERANYTGPALDIKNPNHVCAGTANQLIGFADAMKENGVQVYFANVPYMSPVIGKDEVRKVEISFQKELVAAGCVIDKREDLVFDRKYFFDTNLHLNSEGRSIRTELFIDAIRKNVFSGACQLHSIQ